MVPSSTAVSRPVSKAESPFGIDQAAVGVACTEYPMCSSEHPIRQMRIGRLHFGVIFTKGLKFNIILEG